MSKRKRKRESSTVGSTQDLDECARLYVKNIFSNYIAQPAVTIKKNVYTPGEPSDVTVIDPESNQFTKIRTEKDLDKMIEQSWKHIDTASSLFESVFEAVKMVEENSYAKFKLNSAVVKEGAIVRVWSSINQVDGTESHSVVTIDYNKRRVSFDTNHSGSIKVSLNGTQLPGVAHCIASPEQSFVKKLARVYFDNKEYFAGTGRKSSLEGIVKLKGIGFLTKKNIKILKKYLIDNAINMNHNYISEIYTKHGDDYYAVQPIYRISTNLYYNKYSNIVFNTSKKMRFHIDEAEHKNVIKGSKMLPINCSSFVELLFPDIIFRVNTISLNMLGTMKYIPTAPSMLRPTYNYMCLDTLDNQIEVVNVSKNPKLELKPSVEYNLIKNLGVIALAKKKYGSVAAYAAKAAVALATFFIWSLLPYGIIASILGGAYLIIPLEYSLYFSDISIAGIFSNIQELFSSALCGGFGFVPKCDINTKSVPELKEKYGDRQIDNFIKVFKMRKQMKPVFNFNSTKYVKKSCRRRSVKKSRRRRSVKKSRRRRSVKKSRRRRSVKKSRRRRSVKKSRRRRSVKKSRRRRC